MAPSKASDAFSFGKCCCYALMVMTSPWRLTWATLTCLTASTVLRRFRSIKGTRRWFVKAMDLAFYLCWCHALYHSQLVAICWRYMIWIHWCMWRLFLWIPLKTCLCLALVMFIRSRSFALLLVQSLSRFFLRYRKPPSDMMQIRAYHGTHQKNVESIRKFGFRPSSGGMLGPGIYISRDLNKAQRYAGSTGYRGLGVILELKVEVGTVCTIDRQGHKVQKSWHRSFDTAWVPSNCSMVQSQLEEGCVAEPCNIQLVRVWHQNQLSRLFLYEVTQLLKDVWTFLLPTQPCTDVEDSAGKPHNRVKVTEDWGHSFRFVKRCNPFFGPRPRQALLVYIVDTRHFQNISKPSRLIWYFVRDVFCS